MVGLAVVGCGGSVSAEGEESDTGAGGDDTSIPGVDGGTVDTGGTPTDGGTIKDGTVVSDSSPTDAITPPPLDGTVPPADGGAPGRITCGATTCDAAKQDCCIAFGGGGGSTCIAKGGTCSGAALSCSSAASCKAGEVCCSKRSASGAISSVCEATKCAGTEPQICATDAECPTGTRCRDAVGGFKTCRAGGPPPTDGGFFDGAPPG
ncbi:MAG: hypothetical protein ABI175_14120 [Polyangiales bacterium]